MRKETMESSKRVEELERQNRKLTENKKKLEKHLQEAKESLAKKDIEIRKLKRGNDDLEKKLEDERKKNTEENNILKQKFKAELEISKTYKTDNKRLREDLKTEQTEGISKSTKISLLERSAEANEERIKKLTEKTAILKHDNKKLERSAAANEEKIEKLVSDKHYYWQKHQNLQESHAKLAPTPLQVISPLPPPSLPKPSSPIEISEQRNIYSFYMKYHISLTKAITSITKRIKRPDMNIKPNRMEQFIKALQDCLDKKENMDLSFVQKFYLSDGQKKFALMKEFTKKRTDANLYQFLKDIESAASVLQL